MVPARGSSNTLSPASSTVTGMLRRARASAAVSPTGPAPATRTGAASDFVDFAIRAIGLEYRRTGWSTGDDNGSGRQADQGTGTLDRIAGPDWRHHSVHQY